MSHWVFRIPQQEHLRLPSRPLSLPDYNHDQALAQDHQLQSPDPPQEGGPDHPDLLLKGVHSRF